MKRIGYSVIAAIMLMLLLSLLMLVAAAQEPGAPDYSMGAPATTIVVDSGKDLDTSKSKTCSSEPICTLRRAIVESRLLSGAQLPVLISFDIPEDPDEGWNSALNVWELEILSTLDPSVFRSLKGQVIIDGSTQPDGRSDGPKIILIGPSTGKDGFIVGEVAGDDEIIIRGLGMQNFKTHMYVNHDFNVIEDNWFGLTSDGMEIYLRNDEPEDGSGNTAIALTAGANDNTIRNNVFAGFDGVSIAVRNERNLVQNNLIGTRADGSVPKQTDPDLICTTVDWLGGGGISVDGDEQHIEDNVIAGLRQELFATSTQPNAITVAGDNHIVEDNDIGKDGTGANVGVCGRGIYLGGANEVQDALLARNRIINPELSAISINGVLVDAVTLQGNIIRRSGQWPQIPGNPEPEDAIQFGALVPAALREFKPAKVTNIDGTAVSGTSGTGSPCPNCIIELFLDDTDATTESLQLLATATAGSSGNWSATLSAPLSSGQAIRTTSTSAQYNTIAGMSAGTTTKLSALYEPEGGGGDSEIYLPLMLRP